MPCLLALDTATERMAVGLLAADGRRWHADEPGGALASAELLPRVRALLDEAGIGMADVQAVAFGRGPGAFTGLRTACSLAQGLAFGMGCPVLSIDSLLTVAEAARSALREPADAADARPSPCGGGAGGGVDWWVAMDARMGEVYAAAYRWQPAGGGSASAGLVGVAGRWQTLAAPALYTLPALVATWQAQPPLRVAGNAPAVFGEGLALGSAVVWAPDGDGSPAGSRAAALLRLAEAAWSDGAATDPAEALPLYLRDKVALTTAERLAQRARAGAKP